MQNFKKWTLLFTVLAVIAAFGMIGVAFAQTPTTVTLNAQNGSNESGTATLTDLGNGMVRVDVTVNGEPAGASQPMHIHKGTCANLDPNPAFPLTNVENGTSTTQVTTTLQALMASPFAINGHKSGAEITTYVFCGDIAAAGAQTTATTEATTGATTAATTEATTGATAQATTTAVATDTTTATTAAATVTVTDTTTAVGAAGAATPGATTTPQLPTTGDNSPMNGLALLAVVGAVLLGLGFYASRAGRAAK